MKQLITYSTCVNYSTSVTACHQLQYLQFSQTFLDTFFIIFLVAIVNKVGTFPALHETCSEKN